MFYEKVCFSSDGTRTKPISCQNKTFTIYKSVTF
jgi:hypothetical protein